MEIEHWRELVKKLSSVLNIEPLTVMRAVDLPVRPIAGFNPRGPLSQ